MSFTQVCNEPGVFVTTRNSTDFAGVGKKHLSVRDLWLALVEGNVQDFMKVMLFDISCVSGFWSVGCKMVVVAGTQSSRRSWADPARKG